MYEPVTIVKVRKPTTVKVPAGGWVLLFSPDQPLHQHLAKRAELVREGNINEDFEQILVGRLQDSTVPVKFITKVQSATSAQTREENEKRFADSNADALARQKKQQADAAKAAAEDHKARVEELNEQHAAIREANEGKTSIAAVQLETETEPAAPAPGNEFKAEELNAKDNGELLKLVDELVKSGRITAPSKTSKSALVEALLAAKAIPGSAGVPPATS